MRPVKQELSTAAFSRKLKISRQRVHQLVLEGRIVPAPVKREMGERYYAYFFSATARVVPKVRKHLTPDK